MLKDIWASYQRAAGHYHCIVWTDIRKICTPYIRLTGDISDRLEILCLTHKNQYAFHILFSQTLLIMCLTHISNCQTHKIYCGMIIMPWTMLLLMVLIVWVYAPSLAGSQINRVNIRRTYYEFGNLRAYILLLLWNNQLHVWHQDWLCITHQ